MEQIIEHSRKTIITERPDVLVVGAGPAGIGAAIASARNGAKTMLIEQSGYVGGNLTIAEINPMFTFHDINGKQIINGITEEFILEMVKRGFSIGHVTDLTFDNASMTPLDPEGSKIVLSEMLEKANVNILLNTFVVGTQKINKQIKAVFIENKSGRQAIIPKYVIDCTGDGDVSAMSGAEYYIGDEKNGMMQPVSLFFRIGDVNIKELRQWMKSNRTLLKDNPTDDEIDSQKAIAFLGLNELVKNEINKKLLDEQIANRILMYELPHRQFAVNATRLQGVSGLNAKDMTNADLRLREQVFQIHNFLKIHVGGFGESYIIDTGDHVGVRETRHIIGDYILNEYNVLNGDCFNDGISCGTYAIDIHPVDGKMQIYTGSGKKVYEIPYRSLLPKGFDNLLVAGRCISANHIAAGSVRVMATCMAMGQGAGTAAALLNKNNIKTRNIDIKELRTTLIGQGQYLLDNRSEAIIDNSLVLKRRISNGSKGSHYNPFIKEQS